MLRILSKYNFLKTSAFLLVLPVAAPIFFLIFSQLRQQVIKIKMKERLETSLLQTVRISLPDVVWAEKNKEIRVNDRLFDVKSYQIKNDTAYFTGLFDDEETELEKKVNDLTGYQRESFLSLVKILSLFHTLTPDSQAGSPEIFYSADNSFSFFTPATCSITIKVPTPPPLF